MAAVLSLIGGILDVAFKIREYLVPPIRRQFNYMCCYSNNIEDLQKQIEVLEDKKEGVQRLVRAAENNLESIGPDVKKWLEKVEKIKEEADKLREDTTKVPEGCMKGRCPNLKLRYLLSRRAKKMSKDAIQLQEDGKFERVSYPAFPSEMISYNDPPVEMTSYDDPPKGPEPMETESVVESDNRFRTRKSIEERVMDALLDPNVNIISLCGMGGIGKTTTVGRIGKLLKEKNLFDEVVMVVVTQQPDIKKIQNEIAEMLGLKLKQENPWYRSDRLRRRLLGERRILIILDDIWARLDLEQLGIPVGKECTCKILLTSRARDICVQTGAEVILPLEVLSDEEAWTLFSEEAGIADDLPNLHAIGKEVANECKGLPIALISVARVLKGRSKSSWEDALTQLKRSIPTYIHEVLIDVYRPLELSYSHLNNEGKNLFLLCSLFREDSNISIEDLVRYGIGLTMFNGISNVREGRNRTHELVQQLKDCFLLVDGHKEGYVKMHDVVRDVAISIACKDKPIFLINYGSIKGEWLRRNSNKHCTHMSLFSEETILQIGICPKLVFLLLEGENQKLQKQKYTLNRFRKLNVLGMHYMDIPALTSPIQKLTNLRTLNLCGCKLETLSFIGALVNLEILSFRGSDFKILPAKLGKLANLRLLDLTDCEALELIEQGSFAGLVQLEELHLTKSHTTTWVDVGGVYKKSAGLTELQLLQNLSTLRIIIAGREGVSRNMPFCKSLTEYDISIWAIPGAKIKYQTSPAHIPYQYKCSFQKAMYLFLPTKTQLGEWIIFLLKSTEDLRLNGNGADDIVHELDSGSFQYLKQLVVQECNTLDHLATIIDTDPPSFGLFPVLETLYLHKLGNITEICRGQLPERSFRELKYLHLQALIGLKLFCTGPTRNVSLSNLRSIYIYECPNLESLFSVSVAESLLQLEELDIGDCGTMGRVFFSEDRHDRVATNHIEFPKLNKLVLRCLHKVTSFCAEIDNISFPQLRVLKMEDMPMFKGFCDAECNVISSTAQNTDLQILFNEKVASPKIKTVRLRMLKGVSKVFSHQIPTGFFYELEVLEVESCHGLSSIFSSSVAPALVKLNKLKIKNCRTLMEVIEIENDAQMETNTASFCHSKTPVLFHQLNYLEVDGCDELKTLFPLSIAQGLVNLKELRIRNCRRLMEVVGRENEAQINRKTAPFCHNTATDLFHQLEYLEVDGCDGLKTLFPLPVAQAFLKLKKLRIRNCRQLMEVIGKENEAQITTETIPFCHSKTADLFHQLEYLEVEACDRLEILFPLLVAKCLPELKELRIKNCRRLVEVVEKENEAQMNTNTDPRCQSKSPGLFHQLEYLEVDACNSLKTLLPLPIAQGLFKLNELHVRNCETLVEVVEIEDILVQMNRNATPFPQLKSLELSKLPNVRQFCCTNDDFEIPSLRNVIVETDSPLMEQLAKIAKHSEQMIAYRKICKKCREERVLQNLDPTSRTSDIAASRTSNTTDTRNTTSSTYASCQSYICPHSED